MTHVIFKLYERERGSNLNNKKFHKSHGGCIGGGGRNGTCAHISFTPLCDKGERERERESPAAAAAAAGD